MITLARYPREYIRQNITIALAESHFPATTLPFYRVAAGNPGGYGSHGISDRQRALRLLRKTNLLLPPGGMSPGYPAVFLLSCILS